MRILFHFPGDGALFLCSMNKMISLLTTALKYFSLEREKIYFLGFMYLLNFMLLSNKCFMIF